MNNQAFWAEWGYLDLRDVNQEIRRLRKKADDKEAWVLAFTTAHEEEGRTVLREQALEAMKVG